MIRFGLFEEFELDLLFLSSAVLILPDRLLGLFSMEEKDDWTCGREGDRHPFTQTNLQDQFETPITILRTYSSEEQFRERFHWTGSFQGLLMKLNFIPDHEVVLRMFYIITRYIFTFRSIARPFHQKSCSVFSIMPEKYNFVKFHVLSGLYPIKTDT